MEKKIDPAPINIIRNKPAVKEIAPGLKSSSIGKKIAPEELNLWEEDCTGIQYQPSIIIIRRQNVLEPMGEPSIYRHFRRERNGKSQV